MRLYSWVAHWSSLVSVSVTFTACPGMTISCCEDSSIPMSESAETTETIGSSTAQNNSRAIDAERVPRARMANASVVS